MSRSISMSWSCSGCKNTVADDSDMLVELHLGDEPTVVHVDHVTAIGLKMRTAFYGPYCNRECWDLDAQPGDVFVDAGRFSFTEEGTSYVVSSEVDRAH
jgi:hypothetical protein